MAKKVKLGEQYKDKVTGFVGTATAKVEFMNGCVRYELAGRSKEGEAPPIYSVDEQDIVEADTEKAPKSSTKPGGARSTSALRMERK